MLYLWRALSLGGVETFFVRMAKERSKKGLVTKILLFAPIEVNDHELLTEMKKYAKVYFLRDIFKIHSKIARHFPLIFPLKIKQVEEMLNGITQIHTFNGLHVLFGNRLNSYIKSPLPITVGFYHYITYAWGGWNVPYYERINRTFVLKYLPQESLLLFSQGNLDFYKRKMNVNLNKVNTFRLGVVDKKQTAPFQELSNSLKIVSIGRLVDFKTYNLFMIDVIKKLKDENINVIFDIYGTGSLKNEIEGKIKKLGLSDEVTLKGNLQYSLFDETVKFYDLFVGSGTAIIQASSLGVPSIIGIENELKSKTYGYFCDVYRYEYNLKGLDLPLLDIKTLILEFINMNNNQRWSLQNKHIESIGDFTNNSCSESMEELKKINMPKHKFKYNKIFYQLSYFVDMLNQKYNSNHPKNKKFESFKKEV